MFDHDPYRQLAELRPVPELTLTSVDFAAGQTMPRETWGSGAGGADRSPQLGWSGVPDGTRSIAVSCFDPDAPTGSGYWHWAVYDIDPAVTSLAAGAGSGQAGALPAGAVTLPNEARLERYIGPNPPAGTGIHRYFFVVDALDVSHLDLDPGATPAVLGFNRHYHTLARGILVGHASADWHGGRDAAAVSDTPRRLRACGLPPGTSTPSARASTAPSRSACARTSTCWPCRRSSAGRTSSPTRRSNRPGTRCTRTV